MKKIIVFILVFVMMYVSGYFSYTQAATLPQQTIPTPAPPKSPALPTTYTVQPGDHLYEIADHFGVSVRDIAIANHINDINLINIGQILTIPAGHPKPDILKQIIVILSQQKVYAYENNRLVNTFLVSTGLPYAPTVTGLYQIYLKLDSTRMTGPGYDLPNVPWTMYFYQGYSFHGTYWHHNFGHPMSHGCVNMYTPDAFWLYHWAPLGTPVLVLP